MLKFIAYQICAIRGLRAELKVKNLNRFKFYLTSSNMSDNYVSVSIPFVGQSVFYGSTAILSHLFTVEVRVNPE